MKIVDPKWLQRSTREQFLGAIELRELPSEAVRKRLAHGNALICAMTAATVVLTLLFHDRATSADTAIAGGMELLGMLVSVLIYYSYMQDPDSAEVHTRLFATLIVTNVTGMFLAGCSWLMDGVAALALLHRLCVTALVFVNAAICYQFWLYSAYLLGIEQEKSRRITRALNVFFIFYSVILVVNLFWPIVFAVGSDGVFQRRGLYPLITACLLIILPPLLRGFTQFEGTKREKRIAAMFLLMPLAGMIVTFAFSNRALQYSGVLLSILLAMGSVISGRGKRMAVVRAELDTATKIQESMLPMIFPPFPEREEFEIYASMDPAREVGGDFYDFFMIDDDHLALVIADVSDKGVPAALLMMSAKILINFRARMGGSPAQILAEVNGQLCENNESGMFITVWMGILDVKTGVMTCANAGHEYPAIREDGLFRLLTDVHGLPLGVMPGMKYQDYEIRMKPGDAVFVYTDGVPEANNAEDEQYTLGRMELALNQIQERDPESVLKGVRADVDAFVKGADQFDDLTMLCVAYRGGRSEESGNVFEADYTGITGVKQQAGLQPPGSKTGEYGRN